MPYRLFADATLLLHLAFIVFALLGGLLGIRWRWVPFVHVPAAGWGFFIELSGGICPLTYLENYFLLRAGDAGYRESFIEHYLLHIIYPAGLTREAQLILALVVLCVNGAVYGWLAYRRLHRVIR